MDEATFDALVHECTELLDNIAHTEEELLSTIESNWRRPNFVKSLIACLPKRGDGDKPNARIRYGRYFAWRCLTRMAADLCDGDHAMFHEAIHQHSIKRASKRSASSEDTALSDPAVKGRNALTTWLRATEAGEYQYPALVSCVTNRLN